MYRKNTEQTKKGSLLEMLLNTGSGFLVSLAVWEYGIKPLLQAGTLTIENSIYITLIFTAISIMRGYIWRRVFVKWLKG